MNQKRRNFTQTECYFETKEELVERVCHDAYGKMCSMSGYVLRQINSATNDLDDLKYLKSAIGSVADFIIDQACWLNPTRCDEWCDTVDRYRKAISATIDKYVDATKRK